MNYARGIEEIDGKFVVIRGNSRDLAYETREEALDDLFQPFAWPGGYPVIWFDDSTALCPTCARAEYEADEDVAARMAQGTYTCDVFEGGVEDHGEITCENCGAVLIGPES